MFPMKSVRRVDAINEPLTSRRKEPRIVVFPDRWTSSLGSCKKDRRDYDGIFARVRLCIS